MSFAKYVTNVFVQKDSKYTPDVRQTVVQLLTLTDNPTTTSEDMIGMHTIFVYLKMIAYYYTSTE